MKRSETKNMAVEKADVVIIGGAAVGSAVAYFLRREGHTGRIVVVEKDPTYQWCATGRSVASIRQQFSTPENILLSRFGFEFFSRITEELGPDTDIALRRRGYLIMATAEGRGVLEESIALQRSLGAETELLDAEAMAQRFPWLSTEGLAASGWGPRGEGWVDPHALRQALLGAARRQGVEVVHDRVVALDLTNGRIAGVRLASGNAIACGTAVCAAGWHSHEIAAMAGIDLAVRPKKRLVFVVDIRRELEGCGLMIDPSGLYFRPEGRFYLTGIQPPADEDPDTDDFEIDHAFFDREVWPRLAVRVPAFEALKVVNAWSCHYDYNLLDQNAVIGEHPAVAGLVFACGFSGHGLQHSPGNGRAVAELIVHGGFRSIDLTRLGFARMIRGEPLAERNVY
jgi:FAD-dependent oxidoreductase domain-containing protein 1